MILEFASQKEKAVQLIPGTDVKSFLGEGDDVIQTHAESGRLEWMSWVHGLGRWVGEIKYGLIAASSCAFTSWHPISPIRRIVNRLATIWYVQFINTSTWSYENRVSKQFVTFHNFPCLIACWLCCLLMWFFLLFCGLGICVEVDVDRITMLLSLLPPSLPILPYPQFSLKYKWQLFEIRVRVKLVSVLFSSLL